MHFLWILVLVIPWLTSGVVAVLPAALDRYSKVIAVIGASLGAVAVTVLLAVDPVSSSPEVIYRSFWIKSLGFEFVLMRDGLSDMFLALISWMAFVVTIYAWGYLPYANRHEKSERRESDFYAAMALFTGSMTCAITAGNLLQLYMFWELTGVASYLLIGYWSHLEDARRGALLALGQTVAGGILMLAGFLMLGGLSGRSSFPELLLLKVPEGPWLSLCTILIVAGALAKSAQFPFMSWLPAAMIAPTPVSAFLHSSALVALGVYSAARFHPLLGATQAWLYSLSVPAGIGAICAGFLAFRQEKMKAVLAYSTISQYAFIFIAFGVGTMRGAAAALYAFFVHAFVKAGLFLLTGSVTHVTGERELSSVGYLFYSHRFLASCAAILGFALAGLPALAGFYYKEEILKAIADSRLLVLYIVLLAGSCLSFVYMLRFLYEILISHPPRRLTPVPLPFSMGLGLALPTSIVALTSFDPGWMISRVLSGAIESVTRVPGPRLDIHFEVNTVFWSSVAALCLGAGLWIVYLYSAGVRAAASRLPSHFSVGGAFFGRLYSAVSSRLLLLQSGNIRFYLRWVFTIFLIITAIIWLRTDWTAPDSLDTGASLDAGLIVLLGMTVLITISTLFIKRHIAFILVFTMTGYALGAVFLAMGAPNVAITQILVETLIDLSIILAMWESLSIDPNRTVMLREEHRDLGRWAIALATGTVVGVATYMSVRTQPLDSAGAWYAAQTLARTGMRDFVAAVISDFRALDTFVEITVFAVSVLGISALYWHEEVRGD